LIACVVLTLNKMKAGNNSNKRYFLIIEFELYSRAKITKPTNLVGFVI
jgi:hypothetical protein